MRTKAPVASSKQALTDLTRARSRLGDRKPKPSPSIGQAATSAAWRIQIGIIALEILFLTVTALPSWAQTSSEEAAFFAGKQIRLIVGFGVGGGYDAYARLVAPYLARELGANVIVENQPGAGGVTALNTFVTSKPDGLRIMLANGWSNGISQLMGATGVRYDLTTVSHLGTISASPSVWLVNKSSPYRSIDDVRAAGKTLNWSGLSPDDGLYVGARVTCAALKLNCGIVLGYKDSNEAGLALARGEVDSVFVGDTSANDYTRISDVHALATMARERSRFFPDLPTVFEQTTLSSDGEFLFNFEAAFERLGRILVLPPGVAPARLGFLREVVARALRNPALVAEGEKTRRYVSFIDAGATATTVEHTLSDLSVEKREQLRGVLTADPPRKP